MAGVHGKVINENNPRCSGFCLRPFCVHSNPCVVFSNSLVAYVVHASWVNYLSA